MALIDIVASHGGRIQGTGTNFYNAARTATSGGGGLTSSESGNIYVGQIARNASPRFTIYRGYLLFAVPSWLAQAQLISAALQLVVVVDSSTHQDFDVAIQKLDFDFPLSTNRDTKYSAAVGGGISDGVWRNTSGMSVNTPYVSSYGLDISRIVPGQDVSFALVSSRDLSAIDPGDGSGTVNRDEYVQIANVDNGNAAYHPRLMISYQLPSGVIAML